jgi:hypothetical protein
MWWRVGCAQNEKMKPDSPMSPIEEKGEQPKILFVSLFQERDGQNKVVIVAVGVTGVGFEQLKQMRMSVRG